MTRKRILVGQLWHEGHSFNPVATRREDFTISHRDVILGEARQSATALTGIIAACDALGYRCVPTLAARARPGGLIEQSVFEEIADGFARYAEKGGFDAICFELHGATAARETDDTEGVLLERLRAVVGPDMPIAVALDLHGYITPKLVSAATIITGYRTTPHMDIRETGERAMTLLDAIICRGDAAPRGVMIRLPFMTRGNDETSSGPLLEIGKIADQWRARSDLVDLSIFNIHPFLDVPDLGQVVLAYDEGEGSAILAANDVSQRLWDEREAFNEQLVSVEEALSQASHSSKPFALGDQGDRVVGGGPGDSPEIARIALDRFPNLRVAVPIYDPMAVMEAAGAGEGAEIDLSVGGSITRQVRPLRQTWRVARVGHCRFVNDGPYMAGVAADLGDAAVLVSGRVSVVVTSRAPNVHDPAFFEAMGLPVASQNVLVARAANHYKLSFAGKATCITVDTPGLTAFRPHEFPFERARPFYPLDPVDWSFDRFTTVFER
jgi:microcystin degradation protein MlrC